MRNLRENAIAYVKARVSERELALSVPEPDSPAIKLVSGGLTSAYLIDEGGSFRYVQNKDLASEDVSLETLHESAVVNLENLAKSSMQVQSYGPIYVVLLGGNFEASLLLSDRLWDKGLAHLVEHGFAAAAPARDVLAFCDGQYAAGIEELRAVITRVVGADHTLFNEILYRRGSQWHMSPAA